jgi:hypothetical protein
MRARRRWAAAEAPSLGNKLNKESASVEVKMIRNLMIIAILFLTACSPSEQISTNPPKPVNSEMRIPIITSTPFNFLLDSDKEISDRIKQLYSISCLGPDLSTITPPSDVPVPTELQILEVDIAPDTSNYWIFEIADNYEKNYQAFIACKPDNCQKKLYVSEIEVNRVYEIDWGPDLPRGIEHIVWINNAVFAFYQSSSPNYGRIIAINFEEKKYVYFAVVSDQC